LPSQTGPAAELAREFYRQWNPAATTQPGVRDLAQAEALLGAHGEQAREVLACLVQVTRKEWPECRSLSGAAQKYLADAVKLHEQKQKREAARRASAQARQQARQQEMGRQQGGRQLQEVWDALPEAQREAVVRDVRGRVGASAPAAFVHRLCLEELGRLGANGSSKGGGEP
jgi:ParB-like chromosome segregation protein Spo0J